MKPLNLLPHHIQKQQKSRKLKIYMAALQVAILCCVVIAALVLSVQNQRAENRLRNLAAQIANLDETPFFIATELGEARILARYFDEFYSENFPVTFDGIWFKTIVQALPENASLERIFYWQMEILIEGEATDILVVEDYRQTLINTGLFGDILLGSTNQLPSGNFNFTLRVQIYYE